MKVKVCGLKGIDHIRSFNKMTIDFIGLNFYKASLRHINHQIACQIRTYNDHQKVGVFVNSSMQYVIDMARIFNLDYIQLHGNETPDYVSLLSSQFPVIKVFSIESKEDFDQTENYIGCNYFLFDTKTKDFGGSGRKFDWQLIQYYTGKTPFLLAGGIKPGDEENINKIQHAAFEGIDINSGFEAKPGLKNLQSIEDFINKLSR